MYWIRRRLAVLDVMWLLCQAAGLSAAPIVFGGAAKDSVELHECCRNLAPGQQCPMHHVPHDADPSEERPDPDSAAEQDEACVMRSACAPSDVAVLALAGTLGLLPAPVSVHLQFAARPAGLAAPALHSHSPLPEFPPPRVAVALT